MNKTVTANISGMVFHIEVDAYEKLNSYLNKIRSYFQNSDEREEIMSDIEARIAELLSPKINDQNQVVVEKDVDEVIEVMGKPEQYIQEDEDRNENRRQEDRSSSYARTKKRLFRDPDDRILGGVCSGIGHYVGMDPIWLRLLFVIIFLAGGSGLLIYIILWVVMPEAKTAAEKLQMKGEPVTFDTIGKAFEDGAKKVNEKFKDMERSDFGQKLEDFFEQLFHALGSILGGLLRFIVKIVGVALLVFGVLLVFSLLTGMLSTNAVVEIISPTTLFTLESPSLAMTLFESESQYNMAKYLFFGLIGIPILGLLYGGIMLLVGIRKSYGVGTALGILWLIALGGSVIVGLQLGSQFKSSSKVIDYIDVESSYDVYTLEMDLNDAPGEQIINLFDENFMLSIDKGSVYQGLPRLNIVKSNEDSIRLRVQKYSRGPSKRTSLRKAEDISYELLQQGELITLDSYMSFDRQQKIRGQEVELTLLLPVGKTVYLDESLREMIYDIDNVTGTHDDDMIGQKWIMLERGLTCVDCPDIEGTTSDEIEEIQEELERLEEEIDELEEGVRS